MIHELLGTGRENARTARELADIMNCGIRDISRLAERERREGHPICAATGERPGYYLAADNEELEAYCSDLKNRAIELFKTRDALVKVLNARQRRSAG